ncbi:MAG: choice-of-anchor B family protein [bacterium]
MPAYKRFAGVIAFALELAMLVPLSSFAQYRPGVNNHVTLLSQFDKYGGYSNIWGYTDPQGREYALLGADRGLSIVDLTAPQRPVEVAFVPGPFSGWREIKTHSHYAYVVSEGASPEAYTGVQIVNLAALPDSISYHSYRWPNVDAGSAQAHTVAIDEAGYLYVQGGAATAGTGGVDGGVRIFSLADPEAPVPVSLVNARYVHDAFIRNDILFDSNIYEGGWVDVLDISNRAEPRLLTSLVYPRGFSHNSSTTADGNFLITTDEVNGYTVKFWDIQALWDGDPSNDDNIELVAEYLSNPGEIAHNVHVRGQHAYIAHYNEGVRVLDISNPRDPAEVGYYKTPDDWGVYPYFPSANFAVSDIPTGMYVVRFDSAAAGTVQGRITNSETGEAVAGASLRFVEADRRLESQTGGLYRLRTSAGTHQIIVDAFPFTPDTVSVNLAPGESLTVDRRLQPLLHVSAITGTVHDANGNGLRAKLTLFASSSVLADYTLTTETDAQGRFAFENIFSTAPPLLSYDQLVVTEAELPFATKSIPNIVVSANAPTVLDLTLEPADLLLVNDDPNGQYENFFREALGQIGMTAYFWRPDQRGPVPVSAVPRFKHRSLIWFTGDAAGANVLAPAERDSVAAFLDRGGRLFLTGQNVAESLQNSPFSSAYLQARFVRNSNDFILHGVKGDPVGGGMRNIVNAGGAAANNQNSQDELQPFGFALPCVVFDTTANTVAGVRVESPVNQSRLVFFGFGIEAVATRSGFASRAEVLRSVLSWLEGTTGVDEPQNPASDPALQFELSAGYPNPLQVASEHAAAVMRYQLPAAHAGARVSLKIYDVLGREVLTLVDESYRTGVFTARWQGRDHRGVLVQSGVYFCELAAGTWRQVRKLVIVR